MAVAAAAFIPQEGSATAVVCPTGPEYLASIRAEEQAFSSLGLPEAKTLATVWPPMSDRLRKPRTRYQILTAEDDWWL